MQFCTPSVRQKQRPHSAVDDHLKFVAMGKDKHKKERGKGKVKKEKKDKKNKKHRRRSSSDSTDSDDGIEGVEQQLQRERAAVNKLRDILSNYPAVRKELREMLWRVDQGEAANIAGVPDSELKAHLAQLLELLRLRRNNKGIYGLINSNERTLPVIGFVFDEPPRPKPAQINSAPAFSEPHASDRAAIAKDPELQQPAARTGPIGPILPEPSKREPDNSDRSGDGANDVSAADQDAGAQQQQGHPATATGTSLDSRVKVEVGDQERKVADQEGEAPAAQSLPTRRVAGPAIPPRELLEAAAAAAEALQSAGPPGTVGLSYGDDDDDDHFLVGPSPPELVEELDAAPQDEREAEVLRIVKVLREHAAAAGAPGAGLSTAAAAANQQPADAYDVLGVTPSAAAGEIKKRYMRLSLLIHPDKCAHPLAHEAFQAVASAARVLQDASQRSALDERRSDAELRRRAEAAAAQQERERAWRVARGEEPSGPIGPVGPSGAQRETWMTELPLEMSARAGDGAGGLSQTSVRAFSQRGKTGRGDTSGWTDNPEQRKAREAQAMLAAASEAYVRALPAAEGAAGGGIGGEPSAAAAALDAFNTATGRKRSLMEVHIEMQEKAQREAKAARKAAKKQKTADTARGGQTASECQDWPWRPFDRERDLDFKPKAKSGNEIIKSAAGLGTKFAGGGTQRHFL